MHRTREKIHAYIYMFKFNYTSSSWMKKKITYAYIYICASVYECIGGSIVGGGLL